MDPILHLFSSFNSSAIENIGREVFSQLIHVISKSSLSPPQVVWEHPEYDTSNGHQSILVLHMALLQFMERIPEDWLIELDQNPILWCIQACSYCEQFGDPTGFVDYVFRVAISFARREWMRWPTDFVPEQHQVEVGPLVTHITRVFRSQEFIITEELLLIIGTVVWEGINFPSRLFASSLIRCMAMERPAPIRYNALRAANRLEKWVTRLSSMERSKFSKALYTALYIEKNGSVISEVDGHFMQPFPWTRYGDIHNLSYYFQTIRSLGQNQDWAKRLIADGHTETSNKVIEKIRIAYKAGYYNSFKREIFDHAEDILAIVKMMMMQSNGIDAIAIQLEGRWARTLHCWNIIDFFVYFRCDRGRSTKWADIEARLDQQLFESTIDPLTTFTIAQFSDERGIFDLPSLTNLLEGILHRICS